MKDGSKRSFVEAFAYLIGGQADVLAAGAKLPETRDVRDETDVPRVDFPRRGGFSGGANVMGS